MESLIQESLKNVARIINRKLMQFTFQIFLIILFFSFLTTISLLCYLNVSNKNADTSELYNLSVQINDLHKIKKELENELEKIKIERETIMAIVDKMEKKKEYLNETIYYMKINYELTKTKLYYRQIKEMQEDLRIKYKFNQVKTLNIDIINETSKVVLKTKRDYKSLETCFYLSKCEYNKKLKIFVINKSSKLNFIDFNDDIYEIVNREEDACLSIYFVMNDETDGLENEIDNERNKERNLLVIDLNIINTKNELISYLTRNTKCIIYATYNQLESNDNWSSSSSSLNIHFSILNIKHMNLYKLIFTQNIMFLTMRRHYLLTYHESIATESLDNTNTQFIYDNKLKLIQKIFSSKDENTIIDLKCSLFKKSNNVSNLCFNTKQRELTLLNSTFTIILIKNGWSIENTIRLIESLRVGNIPIIFDIDIKLPLNDLISWDEIILRIPFTRIHYLKLILLSMTEADIINRRIRAFNVFKAYFMDENTQFRTLLTALRHRLYLPTVGFPYVSGAFEYKANFSDDYNETLQIFQSSKTKAEFHDSNEYLGPVNETQIPSPSFKFNYSQNIYTLWNKYFMPFKLFPSTPFDSFVPTNTKYALGRDVRLTSIEDNLRNSDYFVGGTNAGLYFKLNGLGGNHDDEQFTIIMLTYKREKILSLIIDKYLQLPYLNKIIVVWNALDVKPTDGFLNKYKRLINNNKLHIIQSIKNSLNNRFLPYSQIETDAILNVDDDTPLRMDEISFAFRVWRENRHRLVGFPARFHSWNITKQKYLYATRKSCEYSLILTGAVFYHRFFHYVYSTMMDYRVRQMVDRYKNCEDLAFNYMIAAFTRQPPIKVTARIKFFCTLCDELKEHFGSSSHPVHYSLRTDCLNELNLIYGYNPLLYSQTRMDSVLFKTKLEPNLQKCFKYV